MVRLQGDNMKPITTWYKKKPDGDYYYSHFTYGHTTTNINNMLHKNCYLDTTKNLNEVIENE